MSAGPPAANGTMIFTGFAGQACCARAGSARVAHATSAARRRIILLMGSSGNRSRKITASGAAAFRGRRAGWPVERVQPGEEAGIAAGGVAGRREAAQQAAELETLRGMRPPCRLEGFVP